MNCNLDRHTADQKDDFNGATDSKTTAASMPPKIKVPIWQLKL